MALQQGGIDLEDAIDISKYKNLKLANQMLKIKRKEKAKQEQANQQANKASYAQAELLKKLAMAEVQKQEAINC